MELEEPISKNNFVILITSVIIWGLSFPALKVSLSEVQPLTLGLMRMILGAIPLSIFAIWRVGLNELKLSFKRGWAPISAIAITQFYLPLIAQNVGMNLMDPKSAASLSSILQATSPIFAIFFSSLFLGEYIGKKKAFGTALGLSGTILLVTRGGIVLSGTNFYGNLLLLFSAIVYAYSGIIAKKALSDNDPFIMITIGMLIGTLLFLPTSLYFESLVHLNHISITTWMVVLFLGLFSNGIAMVFWFVVLRTTQLSKQTLFTYLIPLFGVVFSSLFIGEVIGAETILFGMITIAGVIIAQYGH
ncbi:MAG: DMT family transporter [Thermoplasmatota archaeon]